MRPKILMMTAVLLTAFTAGCFHTDNDGPAPLPTETAQATAAPTVEDIPRAGGTLKLSMRPPHTLNPLLNEDETVDLALKLLFEPLMALDASLKPVENLASFNFAPDGSNVTLTLRDNLKWSDGVSVTTQDIVYSIQTLKDLQTESLYKNCVANFGMLDRIDDQKIKISFLQPFSGSAYQFMFPIIPEHYYKDETEPDSDANMKPVGNGLYVFDSYENRKSMFLNFNPDTYRKKPYIPTIEVLIVPDHNTAFDAFDQKLLDVVSSEVAEWRKYGNRIDTNVDEYTTNYFDFIGFNFSTSSLQDHRVREAIARCLNIKELITEVYRDHADPAPAPVNPKSWLHEPDTKTYGYDLSMAETLLKQAGYNSVKPLTLRLLVNAENAERVRIQEILAENLSGIGVEVVKVALTFADYSRRLDNKEFDIFVGGFNLSVTPDLSFAFGPSNMFSYQDEVMNALLSTSFSAIGQTGYLEAMSGLQKRIAEDLPCVGLVFRKTALLTNEKIHGEKKPTLNNILSNINEWYIAE